MRKLYIAIILLIIGLLVSGCNSKEQASEFTDKEEPQSVLMFTYNEDNHAIGTLYYQEENQENEQIEQNVKVGGYKLMPDSKAILFLDADNVLWYKAKGKEKEKISSNVTSFDFCKDESTISFITVNDDNADSPAELYIKKMDSEKEKIASDLAHYSDLSYSTFMSDNGDVIFWKDKDNSLYKKEGINEKEKISANADSFSVKNNGASYTYSTPENCYIKWINNTEIQKITDESIYSGDISLCDNGMFAVFISSRNYKNDMSVGELYMVISGGEMMRIASDIQNFKLSADGSSLYYLNDENEVYLKKLPEVTEKSAENQSAFQERLNETEKIKLCTDVVEYKLSADGKNSAFIDKDKNLYVCYSQQEKVRFASDVESFSIFPEMLVYKTAEGKLVMNSALSDRENIQTNNKTLSENAAAFQTSRYGKYIVFSTDEDKVMICADGQAPVSIFAEANEFDIVNYNGTCIYERKLKLSDIAGIYQDESKGMVLKIGADGAIEVYGYGVALYDKITATFKEQSRFYIGVTISAEAGTDSKGSAAEFTFNGGLMVNQDGTKSLNLYVEGGEGSTEYKLTAVEEAQLNAVLERHKLIGRGKNYVANDMYISDTQVLYATPDYGNPTTYTYRNSGKKTILDYQISQDGKLWLKVSGSDDGKYDCFWVPES